MVHVFCAAKKAKLSGMFNGNLTELRLCLSLTRFRRISVGQNTDEGTGGIIPSLSRRQKTCPDSLSQSL